jgi:exodeoxyribonuclease VII small subunit
MITRTDGLSTGRDRSVKIQGAVVSRRTSGTEAAQNYEQLVERLQQVVARLETGELPLAEALALYEEGVALAARCQQLLDNAELRVQQLSIGVDGPEVVPWEES